MPSKSFVTFVTAAAAAAAICGALIHLGVLERPDFNIIERTMQSQASESQPQYKFHQSGFGGINNVGHPAGARAHHSPDRKLSDTAASNVIIPQSANSFAIPSLSHENIENLHGHYVHDEHQSPFASFLYDLPQEKLEAEQKEYTERMNKVRQEWGAWDFNDEHPEIRPIANHILEAAPYRDAKNEDFPKKSWQTDEKYVKDFIGEARKLVDRVREGIYSEYGWPKSDDEEKMKERDEAFKIHITDYAGVTKQQLGDKTGMAIINKKGLDMYGQKLLHAMITNDEFYYVLGGHSAAAGHGNNFQQTYLMEFAHIMEPVLHKLGVRLIARNMAMGGLGTTHFSLGASTLYGETDVMVWDSAMTEKPAGDQDLFHKQVMLGGERFPILMGGASLGLDKETGGNLWYGQFLQGHSGVPVITSVEQAEALPWATKEFVCDKNYKDLCSRGMLDTCWVPRSDVKLGFVPPAQVGGKASWHPGYREHKYHARKQTLLMLKALDTALDIWVDGMEAKGFPLKEEFWHVGEIYDTARSNLSTYINGEGLGTTQCEKRWATKFGLDRACRISLKGMGEFSPTNRGYHNSIHAHVKPAANHYKPIIKAKSLYEGIDLLPPQWKVPEGEVDVHAIAIASTYSAPELDHSSTDGEDDETAENSRRMLRKLATQIISPSAAGIESKANASTNTNPLNNVNIESSRKLNSDSNEVIPGQGWTVGDERTGYCDGSPTSNCNRRNGGCVLYSHNDGRPYLGGDGLSGWLVVNIPEVKEGLVFARMEWWRTRDVPTTRKWTEVNNGSRRELKAATPEWPDDTMVDIAANGKILKSFNKTEWMQWKEQIAYNEAFYPLLDDKDLVKGDKAEPVELGFRIRSETNPRGAAISITHIYYA